MFVQFSEKSFIPQLHVASIRVSTCLCHELEVATKSCGYGITFQRLVVDVLPLCMHIDCPIELGKRAMKNLQKLPFVRTGHRVVFKLLGLFVGNVVFTSAFPLNQKKHFRTKNTTAFARFTKRETERSKNSILFCCQTKDNNSSNNTLNILNLPYIDLVCTDDDDGQ